MSAIDLMVLGGALLLAALAMSSAAARWPARWRRGGFGLVAAAAVLQLLLEGMYWHFLPAYLLLLVLAPRALAGSPALRVSWLRRLVLLSLGGLALTPWLLFLPVPSLPAPSGPYAVGTEVFRWVDAHRDEAATDEPADRRNVIVQAWYPAATSSPAPGVAAAPAPYLDGLGELPPFVSAMPGLAMAYYDRIDTHATVAAAVASPPAASDGRWPVVLFSPGYGGPRAFYTGLLVELASRGFVVLAIDHPYEAALTRLADGRLVTPIERFLPGDPDRTRYMTGQLAVRLADVRFVLDRLAAPGALGPRLGDRLDLSRVAAIGHSFGGATAALAMAADPRLAAAANLDGTLYGALPEAPLGRPLLIVESDRRETRHSRQFLDGNAHLLGRLGAAGYRFELLAANHFSFTDAPLFLSPPARFALAQLIGGGRGPAATQRATAELLAAFLTASLSASSASSASSSSAATLLQAPAADPVEAAAARHGDIRGGRVLPAL